MSTPTSQFSRNDLHQALDYLLASGDASGQLDSNNFWHFVAALGQGRGIAMQLHAVGIEALTKVERSPALTYNERCHRAYHLALTAQLLLDAGGKTGEGSIFPPNYSHGAVVADLLQMLGGPGGEGTSEPQILYSKRGGSNLTKKAARRMIVGAVLYRAASTGRTIVSVREELLPDVEKPTWDSWLKEIGGGKGEAALSAQAAGKNRDLSSPFAMDDSRLHKIIRVVRKNQKA